MSEQSTELPNEWVERLFFRFRVIYGNRLATMWGDVDPEALKEAWAAELGGFAAEDLRLGLEACRFAHKDYPPTLFEFADLCRDAMRRRQGRRLALAGPPPLPADVNVLKRAHDLAQHLRGHVGDPKHWAREILKAEARGEHIHSVSKRYAREALRLPVEGEAT